MLVFRYLLDSGRLFLVDLLDPVLQFLVPFLLPFHDILDRLADAHPLLVMVLHHAFLLHLFVGVFDVLAYLVP